MNKSSFKRPQLPQAQLPLAPLIDVVFILLIFFLLSWKFSKDELDLDIRIPTSSQGNSEQRLAGEIIINLKKSGDFSINGQVSSHEALYNKLERLVAVYPNQAVRIRFDQKCEGQYIADVISTCVKAKVWNISLPVEANN